MPLVLDKGWHSRLIAELDNSLLEFLISNGLFVWWFSILDPERLLLSSRLSVFREWRAASCDLVRGVPPFEFNVDISDDVA